MGGLHNRLFQRSINSANIQPTSGVARYYSYFLLNLSSYYRGDFNERFSWQESP